jgi:hypothetical protein
MASRLPIAAALALVAIAAAGCGGKQKVTAAELVQKGDAICREEQAKFNQIQAQPPVNASDASSQADSLVSAARDANDSLNNLEPPAPLQARYSAYLDARGRATDEIQKGKDAADNQDSAAYGAAQSAVAATAPARQRLARSLGFRVCSQGGAGAP